MPPNLLLYTERGEREGKQAQKRRREISL